MATPPISLSTSAHAGNSLTQPIGWTILETWQYIWALPNAASFWKPDTAPQPRSSYQGGPFSCRLTRIPLFFDTTGITYDLTFRLWVSVQSGSGNIYVLNGNGADYDFGAEIYGWITSRYSSEYLIASKSIADLTALQYHYFLIPASHINSSGYTVLILVHGDDYEYSPSVTGWIGCSMDCTLRYPSMGYIWVEGTKLAYTDGSNQTKRTEEGTLDGATGKEAGIHWVEGTKQRYIDSSGNERYIEGTLTGLTGKLPSQLSINTKAPMSGTHYCYIDSTGAERCFEGS